MIAYAAMYRPKHGGYPTPERRCYFCDGLITPDEKAVRATTRNAWAHFSCWYDGTPPSEMGKF